MPSQKRMLREALQWYVDQGADEAIGEETLDRTQLKQKTAVPKAPVAMPVAEISTKMPEAAPALLGKSDAREQAVELAKQASSLEELRQAIAEFEGIAIKKTATNLVFSDGNPEAPVMLIGEAPGADEDRQGKPFVGVSGQLLDKILACIDLDRAQEDPTKAIYISNILNWRPPGNRTPSPAEIEVSLPFIEKHIALVKPKLLIFCGGVSAKALLARNDSISRLRKIWHEYGPKTPGIAGSLKIPAVATYHPAYLLRTPGQKRAVWQDMLFLQEKRKELGLI